MMYKSVTYTQTHTHTCISTRDEGHFHGVLAADTKIVTLLSPNQTTEKELEKMIKSVIAIPSVVDVEKSTFPR